MEIGHYDLSEEILIKVTAIRKNMLLDNIDHAFREVEVLSGLDIRKGRMEEAELGLTNVLQTYRGVLGDDHHNILFAQHSIARVYYAQGQGSEAEELSLRTIEAWERNYGEDGLQTLLSTTNLVFIYKTQSRLEESGVVGIRALELAKRLGPVGDLVTAVIEGELARTLCLMDRRAEAIPSIEDNIRLRKKVHGEHSPYTELEAVELATLKQELAPAGR